MTELPLINMRVQEGKDVYLKVQVNLMVANFHTE